MTCPACQTELKLADRQGVEIDYCPRCRGVWLDRGELDKIVERSAAWRPDRDDDDFDDHVERDRSPGRYGQPPPYAPSPRKRRSFLGDLFDFD